MAEWGLRSTASRHCCSSQSQLCLVLVMLLVLVRCCQSSCQVLVLLLLEELLNDGRGRGVGQTRQGGLQVGSQCAGIVPELGSD